MKKTAMVWRKGTQLVVCSEYTPHPGTHIAKEPVFVIEASDRENASRAVWEALQASFVGGEYPDWSKYENPVRSAGVGSVSNAVSCAVKLENGVLSARGEFGEFSVDCSDNVVADVESILFKALGVDGPGE